MDLDDLGAKFSRDRSFCFDHIFIHELIFDETNDVTLFCTVPYFEKNYSANFGLTFDQLNTILRNTSNAGKDIATALADHLESLVETPAVIDLDSLYGKPLEVSNFVFYTTLYDIEPEEENPDGEPFEEQDEENQLDEGEELFAFLIEEIVPKKLKES